MIEPYSASDETTGLLSSRFPPEVRFSLAEVEVSDSVDPHPRCRAAGRINPTGVQGVSGYVKNAIRLELRAAGLYDETSHIVLHAKVIEMEMQTLGASSWSISLRLGVDDVAGAVTNKVFEYPWRFEAGAACSEAQAAFRDALSKTIQAAFADPNFAKIVDEN